MATTSTFAFNPATSNLALSALARCGIRRTEVTAQHMADAEVECNLVQVEISNRQPNLWLDELYEQALDQGEDTITLPNRVIAFQAAYITTTSAGVSVDRIIFPYSVYEYAAIPDKTQQAPPTAYWLNMQITPEVKFWPVPDADATYTFKARLLRQIQDARIANGYTIDMPYRWLDVFVAKLAHRLARIYAPDKEALRKQDAEEAWSVAAIEDQEKVPLFIQPALDSYWR